MLLDRPRRGLFLIDLSVPRNIDPACAELPGVHLYNIDDLQLVSQKNLNARQGEIAICQNILRQHESKFLEWMTTASTSAAQAIVFTKT
jgi:glutamyl-tRNA reductase